MVYAHDRILFSNKIEYTTTANNNVNDSGNGYVEWKKPYRKAYAV